MRNIEERRELRADEKELIQNNISRLEAENKDAYANLERIEHYLHHRLDRMLQQQTEEFLGQKRVLAQKIIEQQLLRSELLKTFDVHHEKILRIDKEVSDLQKDIEFIDLNIRQVLPMNKEKERKRFEHSERQARELIAQNL